MAQDILIVDDVKSALENFGNEIRLNLNIDPFLADNPYDALKILSYYPVKVLVTDQDMPGMTGTQLVAKIKKEMGLQIPCIMLTGYADKVSVVDAVNLDFFRFIDKINVRSELTQAIREALQRYEMDAAAKQAIPLNILLSEHRYITKIRNRVSLTLIRISSIIDTYVHENDWKTRLVAERNIKGVKEVNFKRRIKTKYELGTDSELIHKTGFKIGQLINILETKLDTKISFSFKGHYEEEMEIKASYKIEIIEISDKPTSDGLILQSREYQMAPVYLRIKCVLRTDCSTCGIPKHFALSIDMPTNRIALRQIEHYDKGQEKTIYTGFYEGDLSLYETSI